MELYQHDALVVLRSLEIANSCQLLVRRPKLFLVALGVDKERVRIHGFVVADAGDVDA